MTTAKETVGVLFETANIRVGGSRPWDIQVHNEKFYSRLIADRSLGLGESYMEEWWDCQAPDQFIERIVQTKAHQVPTFSELLLGIQAKFFNLQNMQRSRKVIEEHYDLSNELYFSFLDPYNQYTCGYFKNTENLAEAQQFKLNLICRKLKLTAQDTLLDIGCGWGGLAKFAAEQYGCAVAGLTTSREQARYARDFVKGLPVEIIEADYREWSKSGKKYTKIATVGMIEHVGHKNYQTFFNEVSSLLSPSGLFLLHTIGGHVSQTHGDIWSHKYIFPNGMVPSLAQIGLASEGLFILEDMQNFGPYYDKTLMAWEENFRKNWPSIQSAYSEKFYRMWRYYFLSFAGSFRARRLDLWQLVFSKEWDSRGIYQAER